MEELAIDLSESERRSWQQAIKILVSGPFAAGKTSFIATASDIEPLQTEVEVSQNEGTAKDTTTVALDFGKLELDSGLPVFLFGTPGQARFEFLWDILAQGMQGLLFLVDATNPADFNRSREMLSYFQQRYQVPIVVCANKQDSPGAQSLEMISAALQLPETVPLLPLCSLQKTSVIQAIKALIGKIKSD